jgi:isoquinoline 1-oxidoreductase alpha subunit
MRGVPAKGGDVAYAVRINGEVREVDVESDTPMLWVLRDVCGLTGTKFGCGAALCGACTIHVDGKARRSCVMPVASVGTSSVGTIEALHESPIGQALQRAWRELDVVQCGYCQSGQLMSAAALLAANPHPTDSDIDAGMSGNICRCGTYKRIRAGITMAARFLAEGGAA